jgi:hypothetical protein
MNSYYCLKCNADRPVDDNLPCLACGGDGKKVLVGPIKITASGTVSAKGFATFVYYKTHKLSLAVVILITVLSSVSGLFLAGTPGVIAGLCFGVLSFIIGPYAKTKIIKEVHRK